MKRTLSLVLSLIMILGIFTSMPVTVNAVTSGTTGDCTWSLDGTVLTISGNGAMADYDIDYEIFRWGNNITDAIITNGVTSIGDYAFYNCSRLKSIAIPNSVISIGENAFWKCTSLTSINIPDTVMSIGANAFYRASCQGEWYNDGFYINNHLIETSSNLSDEFAIREGTKSIAYGAFSTTNLTSITIPDGLIGIGDRAFSSCEKLEYINIPDSVLYIGDSAFSFCKKLESITVPQNVSVIGDAAFYCCNLLEEICWKPKNVPDFDYDSNIFYNAGFDGNGIQLIFGDGVERVPGYLFCAYNGTGYYYSAKIKSIVVPESVESIGYGAFYKCPPISDVYYKGSKVAYTKIKIENNNKPITDIDWHYNYVVMKPDAPKVSGISAVDGINITWDAVVGGTKYGVYRRNAGSSTWSSVGTTRSTRFVDRDVVSGKYYIYSVRAYNCDSIYSDYNSTKTKTVMYISTPRTTATNLVNGVQVKWSAISGATKYNVYRRVAGSSSWVLLGSPTGTSLVDKNVKNGTYYVYSVRAINGVNISAFDTNKTVTIQPVTAPTPVTTNLANGVQVSWAKATGATKYNVYRRLGGTSAWIYVGQTTGTSLVDKGVTNGKYYVYSIRAINGTGYSAFDTSKTDTIQPITAPTAKVANKSSGVQVSWNSVSGATKYNVYRRLGGSSTWIYVGQTTGTSLIDTGVVKGKSYAYSIRAINGTGYSAYNSSKCAAIKRT